MYVQDLGMGRGRRLYLQYILKIVRAGDNFVRIGDMGDDPPDQSNPGGFPPHICLPVGGYATVVK